jgi:hypothetical protein
MKRIKCKKCGHEISLGIDDEERNFICCDQLMAEVTEKTSFRNSGFGAVSSKPIIAEQPCNNFTGNLAYC